MIYSPDPTHYMGGVWGGDDTKPVFALWYSLSGARSSAKSSSMASQPAPGSLAATDINSFIRGFHEYKDIWQPMVRENLILKKEPTNEKARTGLLVLCPEGQVVGHVP